MNTNHKTFGGMRRAAERLAQELTGATVGNDRDYQTYSKRVDGLLRELNGLWSNPADVSEAAKLRVLLLDAWHAATV